MKSFDGLNIAQKVAKENGGRCLSGIYINNRTKMEWECVLLHKWLASLSSVKYRNHWCPECKKVAISKKT